MEVRLNEKEQKRLKVLNLPISGVSNLIYNREEPQMNKKGDTK